MAAGAALGLALCLSGCAGWRETLDTVFRAVSPIQPASVSGTDMPSSAVLPEDAKSIEGLVLDASDGLLILRAVEGGEYVFRMEGAQDLVEGGTAAGHFVRLWYSGVLEDTNARNVKLLRIETAQEIQPDTYDRNCMAEGYIVSCNDWRITLCTASGDEYTFMAGENVRAAQELTEGMWVCVYFDGTPGASVVSRVSQSISAADVFTVIGTLRGVDEEAGTITLQADGGGQYTFSKDSAQIVAPNGLWADKRRFVLSYRGTAAPGETEHAVLLRVCAEKAAGDQTVQGVVCDINETRKTVSLCTANGRVLTFPTGSEVFQSEKGVHIGDSIAVTYTGCINGEDMHEVEVVSLAVHGASESSVVGEVYGVTDKTLTLCADDGRMLQFRLPSGKYFPERMKKGDTIRVTYVGWIESEDTANASYVSASRAYI